MLLRFFLFLIYAYFNKAFVKNFLKKLSFFNTNFQNSFQDIVCYRILRCQNFVIIKWRPLNIRQNLKKRSLLFRSEIDIFDIFVKSFEDLQIDRIWKFQNRSNWWKLMKNVFYFILKTLSVSKYFNFWSFRKNGLIKMRRLISKFVTLQPA